MQTPNRVRRERTERRSAGVRLPTASGVVRAVLLVCAVICGGLPQRATAEHKGHTLPRSIQEVTSSSSPTLCSPLRPYRCTIAPSGIAPVQPSDYRSPKRALRLSLGSTVGALALFALLSESASGVGVFIGLGGLVIGPSLGHFYADHQERALTGILVRLMGMTVFTVGAVMSALSAFGNDQTVRGDVFAVVAFAGAGFTLGSAVLDIIRAPASAQRHNERAGLAQVYVAPQVTWAGRGRGLALGVRF